MTTTHSTKDNSYILKSDWVLNSIFPTQKVDSLVKGLEVDKIFRESPVVNCVVNFTTKEYSFVSDNVLTIFGVSPTELISGGLSNSIFYFAQEHREIFSDGILPSMGNWLKEAAEKGMDVCKTKVTYHVYMLNQYGKKFSSMHILKPITKDQNGMPLLAIKYIIDISLHKPIIQPNIRFEHLNSKEEYVIIENKVFYTTNDEEQSLSIREQEILNLVTHGYKSKEIADKLSLSLHTVNNHRKNIVQKCKVKSLHQITNPA